MDYMYEYHRWLENAADDVRNELERYNSDQIEDAFYKDLSFGTGGLRGIIGAGTNRMNVHTVMRASQGLADYVNGSDTGNRSIAIAYDSRHKSDDFAKISAEVFAANGIKVYIYPELMPTPCLSYAVRYLGCNAGIMITASHNPADYNGYKVYNSDGCQITDKAATAVFHEIEKLDVFNDIKTSDFETELKARNIQYIDEDVLTSYIEQVKNETCLTKEQIAGLEKNISIVYTPLNGTGLKPVLRALRESGFNNISVVKEQEQPDGNFPTCPKPNPEIREAMELGIEYARENKADIVIATDPDCDRVGIAVRNSDGDYILISGNEAGVLLLDYICSRRTENHTMPDNPVMIKTIVTTDMAEAIAENYGVRTINVLTGFKYIGEKIDNLKDESYIFGFEESYGYLSGTHVRDKDAVNATLLICEMLAYYKAEGISLIRKLEELYEKYGYRLNRLVSFHFEGSAGFEKMQRIIGELRKGIDTIGGKKVISSIDYLEGIDGLPKSDVISFLLEEKASVICRPSGTEPKLKIYVSVAADSKEEAESQLDTIIENMSRLIL